jgi:phenylalanine-4-hydroxylase
VKITSRAVLFLREEEEAAMSGYTDEQHETWRLLYDRRMEDLSTRGSAMFLEGAVAIGLERERIPDLAEVNRRLERRTGWQAVPVDGFIPAHDFFALLARRRFPTVMRIRDREKLDYVPEPDIFHDLFGHVPLHSHPVFADFLQRFGEVAMRPRDEVEVMRMARLFWFTVEFGVIHENGQPRVYGSGLISSQADCANALSDRCERRPFALDEVMNQPFEIDRVQDVLFTIDSFDELFAAIEVVRWPLMV